MGLLKAFKTVAAAATMWAVQTASAFAQAASGDASGSIFADAGMGKKWLGDFFPYALPRSDDVHAVLGDMLGIYNTGLLVFASIIALYSLVTFIAESAHHGEVGGKRHGTLYAQFRMVVAIALLVPISHGYNTAQIVTIQLAHAGSGLANTVWRQFTPYTANTDFNLPLSRGDTISDLLQKALVDETCLAAVALDKTPSTAGPPSIAIQAYYRDPAHPGHEIEGIENPLTLSAADSGMDAMKADDAITTESETNNLPVDRMRIHYNRAGLDDYCGAIDLPVPAVPMGAALEPQNQALYAEPFLEIRAELGQYAQSMAAAVASQIKPAPPPKAASGKPAGQVETAGGTVGGAVGAAMAAAQGMASGESPAAAPASPAASPAQDLPNASMSASAWDGVVNAMESKMSTVANRVSHQYIDSESTKSALGPSSGDWFAAGSLFFKLTKLSHDNVRLRYEPVSATLPDPAILPAEMRGDGKSAPCVQMLNTYFLADYNCRTDGEKTTLSIKVAYNLIHSVESQRGTDVVPAIDGGMAVSRKEDTMSSRLFADAGLDGVVTDLGKLSSQSTDQVQHSAMFDVVNFGNMLMLSTSGLFQQSAILGQSAGGTSQSLILSLFALLLLLPAGFLSIVLPLMPAARFFLGIAAWLLTLFECLVGFPLVLMGQLRSEGEGLIAHGRQGYLLLLQMVLRPVLMVFGLMAAIAVFEALYGIITWAIWSALLNVSANSGQLVGAGIQGVLELTGYIMLWSALIYMAANLAFRAINAIPDRVLAWIGSGEMPAIHTTVTAVAPQSRVSLEGMPAVPVLAQDGTRHQIPGDRARAVTSEIEKPPEKPLNAGHIPKLGGPEL